MNQVLQEQNTTSYIVQMLLCIAREYTTSPSKVIMRKFTCKVSYPTTSNHAQPGRNGGTFQLVQKTTQFVLGIR